MGFNAKKVTEELVVWIRKWFDKNGNGCNAVVGISGGIDSSTVAALCVKALGEERVYGVLMPDGSQRDIQYSHDLIKHLGIDAIECDISSSINAVKKSIVTYGEHIDCLKSTDFARRIRISEQAKINLLARIRMTTLYAVSQSVNGRVMNTCNLSESYCGYDTRWGDSVGDVSPLAMLTKTEVRAIATELGLPNFLIDKIPTDGLCGKTDEENFGFSYAVLDRYIRTDEIDNLEVKKKIDELHMKNLFKLKPMAHFEYKGE